MKQSSGPRKTANLSESVNHNLNMYAVAAGAAGVSLLALVQLGEAKIVYTPAHVKIVVGSQVYLDLNNDGVNDFLFYDTATCHGSECFAGLSIQAVATGNGILSTQHYAPALHAGVRIGGRRKFTQFGLMANWNSMQGFRGRWANGGKGVKNRYLGLEFIIEGKTHFGWARVSVPPTTGGFTATLTGYAYETIPGKAIIAGATKGPDDAEPTAALSSHTPEPVTLGALALGTPGLSIWRRKESAAAAFPAN